MEIVSGCCVVAEMHSAKSVLSTGRLGVRCRCAWRRTDSMPIRSIGINRADGGITEPWRHETSLSTCLLGGSAIISCRPVFNELRQPCLAACARPPTAKDPQLKYTPELHGRLYGLARREPTSFSSPRANAFPEVACCYCVVIACATPASQDLTKGQACCIWDKFGRSG